MKVFDHDNAGNTCEITVFFYFLLEDFTLILWFLFGSRSCQSLDPLFTIFFTMKVFDHNNAVIHLTASIFNSCQSFDPFLCFLFSLKVYDCYFTSRLYPELSKCFSLFNLGYFTLMLPFFGGRQSFDHFII